MEPISIMLVDDNPSFLRATTQFLEAQDNVIVVGMANGGAEALEQAPELQPHVILVDLAMPGIPGLEVIPRLRRLLPHSGIIALTVMNTKSFRKAALDAGADAFIPKPAMRTGLLPAIHKIAHNGQGEKEKRESIAIAPDDAVIRRRVLLMEDDYNQRRLYTRVLRNAGYRVEEAGTIKEAHDLIGQRPFGVFLCDIHMGRERGTDLVREQKTVLDENGTQVIMISADTQYRSICREMGIQEYLEKPVSLMQLVQVVNRVAERK